MRKFLLIAVITLLSGTVILSAQENVVMEADTLIYQKPPLLDSSLLNLNIFNLISQPGPYGASVSLWQSESVTKMMSSFYESSQIGRLVGYRVRIFFDNKQNARTKSQEVMEDFLGKYPYLEVYRYHDSPFFKVTVGDFRTKSEAMRLLRELLTDYPAAFVVRELINFPPL